MAATNDRSPPPPFGTQGQVLSTGRKRRRGKKSEKGKQEGISWKLVAGSASKTRREVVGRESRKERRRRRTKSGGIFVVRRPHGRRKSRKRHQLLPEGERRNAKRPDLSRRERATTVTAGRNTEQTRETERSRMLPSTPNTRETTTTSSLVARSLGRKFPALFAGTTRDTEEEEEEGMGEKRP